MIKHIKDCLMYRITSRERKCEKHKDQRLSIETLFQRTIQFGESNSTLLIGSRGSGKTWLVNSILQDLYLDKNFAQNVSVVRLNGLIHTNDRLSLNGIAQQLELENVINDKVFGTFAENLTFLLEYLRSGNKKESRPIIFILDEFDLFCAHKNQTLLYNLFDIAQSAQLPICVLGITCHLNVIELFEKRVKSRYSHRQIYMDFNNNTPFHSPIELSDYFTLTKKLLTLPNQTEADEIELQHLKQCSQADCNNWNKSIDKILKINAVQDTIQHLYHLSSHQNKLRNFLMSLLCNLSNSHMFLDADDFRKTSNTILQDDKCFLLQSLSIVEICLIIAIKKETCILDGEPFNYKMILERYLKFVKEASEIKSVGNLVIMKAFEHLKNLEIIIPVNKQRAKENKEYQMYNFAMTSDQVSRGIKNYGGLPTEIIQWLSSIAVK